MGELTKAQIAALDQYNGAGVTSQAFGSLATFRALVRKGYLSRSYGLGAIEAEITPEGRFVLAAQRASKEGLEDGI